MRTSNSNTMSIAHQFAKHFGPSNDRNSLPTSFNDFWVIGIDRTRHNHHVGTNNVVRFMPDRNLRT